MNLLYRNIRISLGNLNLKNSAVLYNFNIGRAE